MSISAVLRLGRRYRNALAVCAGAGAVLVLAATMSGPPHARAAEASSSAAGASSGAGQAQADQKPSHQNQAGQNQAQQNSAQSQGSGSQSSGSQSSGSQSSGSQSSGSDSSGKQASGSKSGAPANTGTQTGPAETAKAREKARVQKALARTDKRLADLKASLGITQSETSSWHAFAQVARDHAKALAKMQAKREEDLPHMNAVQNIESYAAITAKEADDMNALSAAFQTLYGKLTKSQQGAADELFRQQAQKQAGIRLGPGHR